MEEYSCEYCQLPIEEERLEVAYINGRLAFFHPVRCKNSDGTDCAQEYIKNNKGELNLVSTTKQDLEQRIKIFQMIRDTIEKKSMAG